MAAMTIQNSLRMALCQLRVGADKALNISQASAALASAQQRGAGLAVLPECWNCPYSTAVFAEYGELVPNVGDKPNIETSPSSAMLCNEAKKHGLWIVGGSIPEKYSADKSTAPKIFNTSIIVNPAGDIVGKHRKVHLFDIDIPGKITFKESDALTAGDSVTTVETPWGVIGVGICYDIRFPELGIVMRERGAKILVYPGAFNMTTVQISNLPHTTVLLSTPLPQGPAHWELLQRARAVDNQVFVATCSPARNEASSYTAWGHSTVVSPWGDVVEKAEAGEDIVIADINLSQVDEVRKNVPCWHQKRHDLYKVTGA